MKNVMTGTYIRKNEDGEQSFNFDFYTELSVANKLSFVNSVVNVLVDDEGYYSIIRDLIFDYYIIEIFTDIDTSEIGKNDFINNVEQFLDETNVVDIVKANVEASLFDELNKAIDNSIAYRTGIHLNPLSESIASLINTFEKKINEVDIDLGTAMEVAQKFMGVADGFTLENIVNAYMSSDMHKKNIEEIAENNKQKIEVAESLDKAIKTVNNDQKLKTKK